MQGMGPLSVSLPNLLNNEPLKTDTGKYSDADGGFANILLDAFTTVEETNTAVNTGGAELLMGMSDDLSGLLLDMQKAELALQLALQIRNKIMDAYNEVIKMSV